MYTFHFIEQELQHLYSHINRTESAQTFERKDCTHTHTEYDRDKNKEKCQEPRKLHRTIYWTVFNCRYVFCCKRTWHKKWQTMWNEIDKASERRKKKNEEERWKKSNRRHPKKASEKYNVTTCIGRRAHIDWITFRFTFIFDVLNAFAVAMHLVVNVDASNKIEQQITFSNWNSSLATAAAAATAYN